MFKNLISKKYSIQASETYFHVTEKKNLKSILSKGLVPQIGPLSQKLGEDRKAVYLFATELEMENALANWLGEEFEEMAEERGVDEVPCVALKVMLPDGFVEKQFDTSGNEFFEAVCLKPIPPQYIKFFKDC